MKPIVYLGWGLLTGLLIEAFAMTIAGCLEWVVR